MPKHPAVGEIAVPPFPRHVTINPARKSLAYASDFLVRRLPRGNPFESAAERIPAPSKAAR